MMLRSDSRDGLLENRDTKAHAFRYEARQILNQTVGLKLGQKLAPKLGKDPLRAKPRGFLVVVWPLAVEVFRNIIQDSDDVWIVESHVIREESNHDPRRFPAMHTGSLLLLVSLGSLSSRCLCTARTEEEFGWVSQLVIVVASLQSSSLAISLLDLLC
jgi:hypothetical protein